MTEPQRQPNYPSPAPRVPPIPPPPQRMNVSGDTGVVSSTQPIQPIPSTHVAVNVTGVSSTQPIQPIPSTHVAVNTPEEPLPLPSTSPRLNVPRPAPPSAVRPRQSKTNNAPTLEQLVREAYDRGISDLHLGVGEVPRFRDRGQIILTDHPLIDEETFFSWLREILSDRQIEQFKEDLEFDGATQYEGLVRVRINIFVALNGPAMVLRLIPLKILTMEQLNLPQVFRDLCHYHKGLILVTGPTGSGKSTTMAAMIDFINKTMPKNIISIEDPVEFVHVSQKSLIKQREVGIHTLKFDNALKASLREDPDIILIGEMRDRETVNTALKAAQTGHLVFGTLHTNSAVKTIERILNLYNPEEQGPMRIQVAESLVAVIAQSLVRTTDSKRAAVHEIMINTDAIKDYIIRNQVEEIEAIIPRCGFEGMCTMNQSLYQLYEQGRITEETALEASPKPNEMAMTLRGRV
ncbi:type IV pilus twitching motility protein PilT [Scytonema millei]|uniref:PilT/PilU family type 4a pilus ATPase n=1 Tax=Scytonema millei VB511283 TaxID=1245923 RepID=A0A9X5I527_9CYAN|nr:type IV pilus twitching motility protein PilT [Scytonema millei]NHC34997.1 PilT/PilU family type 4a pilus ATPase [Scytonema millei VB511283]